MASIRKYRDKWRAEVQRHGVRASFLADTKREAQAWALKKEAELDARKGRHHTLQMAVERYLETVSPLKRDAVQWETRRFDEFLAYFGEGTPLADITSDDLARWRDDKLKTVSGSTVNRYVNLYRNLFRTAWVEWKWIDHSPFEGVKLPKENLPREIVWGWREIRRVLREGQKRGGKTLEVTQAFHIALHTAMRLKEALGCSFDARRRVAILPPSKTNERPDEIPLTPRASRILASMPKFAVEPNEASTLFSDLLREMLIDGLQFRDSRATALTLLSRRVDVLTLARISRHRDIRLLSDVYYRETAEQISRRLGAR